MNRILIVEDEIVTRNTLKSIFEAEGYIVHEAIDGAEMHNILSDNDIKAANAFPKGVHPQFRCMPYRCNPVPEGGRTMLNRMCSDRRERNLR